MLALSTQADRQLVTPLPARLREQIPSAQARSSLSPLSAPVWITVSLRSHTYVIF